MTDPHSPTAIRFNEQVTVTNYLPDRLMRCKLLVRLLPRRRGIWAVLALLGQHKVILHRCNAILHHHNPVAMPLPTETRVPITPVEMAVTKDDLVQTMVLKVLIQAETM